MHALTPDAEMRREARALIGLALPLMASQLSGIGMELVNTVLAGHLGPRVLGATAVGGNVFVLAIVAVLGVMMALPPSVAQLDGAGRRQEIGPLFRQAVYLALGLGVLLQQALWWGGPALVAVSGLDADIEADADAFLRTISLGVPALGLVTACRGLSDGLSLPKPGMVFGLLGLALLVPVGYALMYGRFGLQPRGAAGSGVATALVLWLEAAGLAAYLRVSPRYRALGWERGRRGPDLAVILGLLRLGGPIAAGILLEAGLFSGAGLLIARFGAAAAASHQLALNVTAAAFMVPLGLATAITVRVGLAAGRGDPAGVRRAGLLGVGLTALLQTVSCAAMAGLPHAIVSLYTSDPAIMAGAVTLLGYAALFQVSDGVQVTANGALRGLKDAKVPLLITALTYWGVAMPLGSLLAFPLGLRAPGMWIGLVVGLSCAACLLLRRFLRLTRLNPSIPPLKS
jgi:multidrug resistance protein, MATE family